MPCIPLFLFFFNMGVGELLNAEVSGLAQKYISEGVLPTAKIEDAMHASVATVFEMDALISWNLKHLSNFKKMELINGINMKEEYCKRLESITPMEVFKHKVETYEVEEVLCGKPKFRFVEKGEREDEDVYLALGQTVGGRYLTVLFIFKETKEALILSAREMAQKERRLYGEK